MLLDRHRLRDGRKHDSRSAERLIVEQSRHGVCRRKAQPPQARSADAVGERRGRGGRRTGRRAARNAPQPRAATRFSRWPVIGPKGQVRPLVTPARPHILVGDASHTRIAGFVTFGGYGHHVGKNLVMALADGEHAQIGEWFHTAGWRWSARRTSSQAVSAIRYDPGGAAIRRQRRVAPAVHSVEDGIEPHIGLVVAMRWC